MIEEQAVVTQTMGNRVEIQMQRQTACGHCELSRGCGTGAIGRMLGHRSKPLVLESTLSLKPGDRILLAMPERSFLMASLLIYGLPLLALVLAAIIGQLVFGGIDSLVVTFAVCGLLAGLAGSALLAKKQFARQLYPRIVRVEIEPTEPF